MLTLLFFFLKGNFWARREFPLNTEQRIGDGTLQARWNCSPTFFLCSYSQVCCVSEHSQSYFHSWIASCFLWGDEGWYLLLCPLTDVIHYLFFLTLCLLSLIFSPMYLHISFTICFHFGHSECVQCYPYLQIFHVMFEGCASFFLSRFKSGHNEGKVLLGLYTGWAEHKVVFLFLSFFYIFHTRAISVRTVFTSMHFCSIPLFSEQWSGKWKISMTLDFSVNILQWYKKSYRLKDYFFSFY